jgi:GST-like protein
MIELYFFPTPNGRKIAIFLEEAGVPYKVQLVDMWQGEQFKREFLLISPNNKIPVIVDHAPSDGGAPLPVFESAAILMYLADKLGKFYPTDPRRRLVVTQWLIWQVAGLGPMAGQLGHFGHSAPEQLPYAIDRYRRETNRLYAVLDRQLTGRAYIADDYSIADMACYPWIAAHDHLQIDMTGFPELRRWLEMLRHRPAISRAFSLFKDIAPGEREIVITDEFRKTYWGQSADTLRQAWADAGL